MAPINKDGPKMPPALPEGVEGEVWIRVRDREDAYVRSAQPALDERAGGRWVVLDPVARRQVCKRVVHLADQVPALDAMYAAHAQG